MRENMKRVVIFGLLSSIGLIGTLASLYMTATWWARTHPDMTEMMRRMMGAGPVATPSTVDLPLIFLPALFLIIAASGLVGFTYHLAMPDIPKSQSRDNPLARADTHQMILRTLTPEERRVIEVLLLHNRVYLQKYLSKEAGLSRLRTHRLVKRLAERGILSVSPKGNTNEVRLSEWLRPPPQEGS
jgi:uncharacterized membrane protein